MLNSLCDTLSIIGVVVSITGVIVSLFLFNASINNNRKILLNNVLNRIMYDVFFMFSTHNPDSQRVSKVHDFNRALMKIDTMLNEVDYNNKGVPLLSWSTTFSGEKATQTFHINNAFKEVKKYFERRHIKGMDVFIEYFDDRISLIQCYEQRRRYIHKFVIGPIIGIKVYAVRNKKKIAFNDKLVYPIPIKKIRNLREMKIYYDKCYMKFDSFVRQNTVSLERNNIDVTQIVKKGEEIPPTFYR